MSNLKIGAVVGSDFYGPCMHVTTGFYCNTASEFGMLTFVQHSKRKSSATPTPKQTKHDIPESMDWLHGYYKIYSHLIDI